MSGVANPRRRFLLVASQAVGATALWAGIPGMRAALAGVPATQATGTDVVALAFDQPSQSLLKASANAVYRSGDGGRLWTPVQLPSTSAPRSVTSIAVSAGAKGSLYVSGPGIGVLRSDNAGRNWSARNEGLPRTEVTALAAHADRPETVYAYANGHGIFRSEDGGQHWRLMDAGPRGGVTRFVHSNMPGSMQSGWLFVAGPQGVRRAMDCFCGWRDAGELGRAVDAVAYDPRRPSSLYAATDAGLVFSADGGEKWSQVNAPAVTIGALVVTPDGALYAGGADGNVFRRSGAATPWERMDA
ncbi:MAG: hypothetical protein EPN64_18220 [Burkholderiaceae bacterium]|nr:MAG: hypothetical protein EPN64_18220 [Burkholderiaceae bacterium]